MLAGVLRLGVQRHGRAFHSPPPARWPSIVSIELAGSGQTMGRLLDRLGAAGWPTLRQALRIDTTQIVPSYTGMLMAAPALSIVWVRALDRGRSRPSALSRAYAQGS